MDRQYMGLALDLARCAAAQGEVPVGAVVVHRGRVVGWGYNTREQSKNALDHAEIKAIDMACRNLGGWRLPDCALYVTLEPCAMCAGAIINARIDRVCFGARDEKFGACGSVVDLFSQPFTYCPKEVVQLMEEESRQLLREFFAGLRARKRAEREKGREG
ncbi:MULTISPECIES: nucleoside deaminase [Eubacteriales]|uniref:tRNA-specific adenosine deaminase n=1 Tax=Bittarella massiliensis (ex Durand et al. 2017) TaxID=1720313 RepID=A0AAQ1RWI5_9FIRM|nr:MULTISPECIES: nucleoside deaminase [Eubacteriales]ERI98998.1 cytidine and deoxycytidylate deaminase zinc-binding region [Clostridium sp. ATCC 29733]MZL70427.1 tRNA-specific adenosine deaminase [Bittarella massiliensis (ex Durand et al. 2017)]MZL80340.1 tRNA-specific adenosine deaminase [Bittarella massiliensis (ex Durand et al. 2017)]SHG33144.1 tRNA(adenine34) deaminase [Bittarella massiliensis (ex Durand et al. 2017)]